MHETDGEYFDERLSICLRKLWKSSFLTLWFREYVRVYFSQLLSSVWKNLSKLHRLCVLMGAF